LGDNREASYDSREWGSLREDKIVGKVWLRLAPINKVKAFSLPKY
jgi:type IV secretory pathway protease TraF